MSEIIRNCDIAPCFISRRIPCIGYLYKWFCKCRIERLNFNFRSSHRQSEQTNVDVTSAKYVIVTKRGYRYLVKSNLKHDETNHQNGPDILPTTNNDLQNGEIEKAEHGETRDISPTCQQQNPSNCHFRRRPSGLPLANRKMTDQETILLETYRTNGKRSMENSESPRENETLDNFGNHYDCPVNNRKVLTESSPIPGSYFERTSEKHKLEETILV